ncbi:unnamed protein product, partial [Prorocentrum cordatum]
RTCPCSSVGVGVDTFAARDLPRPLPPPWRRRPRRAQMAREGHLVRGPRAGWAGDGLLSAVARTSEAEALACLAAGACVNQRDDSSRTALHLAAAQGLPRVCLALLWH